LVQNYLIHHLAFAPHFCHTLPMRILAIETSCDETAVSIIETSGDFPNATYRVLGNALFSQIDIHREYGGVFPMVAKREHAKALVPMLKKALDAANIEIHNSDPLIEGERKDIEVLLMREDTLASDLIMFAEIIGIPEIDLIAVTEGPGLEPALWVGVNFSKALAMLWKKPLMGINHMEGHVISSVFEDDALRPVTFPLLSLLISGGHTELVLSKAWGAFELVGQTRDDAVGEAFDKVARLLGLPYPGGPEISRLAKQAREEAIVSDVSLPRPMMNTADCDFSFSGLKTAVMYAVKAKGALTETDKLGLAREFEDAATEVLVAKTLRALQLAGAQSLAVGGGVSANMYIREQFEKMAKENGITLYFPERSLATDNAIMIALAAHAKYTRTPEAATLPHEELVARGNLALHA
jgi:N6-L-threonylcarbamoyladenine synthase